MQQCFSLIWWENFFFFLLKLAIRLSGKYQNNHSPDCFCLMVGIFSWTLHGSFLSVIIATDNTFFYVKILSSTSITGNWLYLIIHTDTKRHYVSFSRRTASRRVSSKRAFKYKYTPNTRSTNHSEKLLMRKLLDRHFPLLDTSDRHQDGRVVFFVVPKSVMEHGIVLS